MVTSTTAVTNRRRRLRWAGCITVSSKPTITVSPTRLSSSTSGVPCSVTADHAVDHDTPSVRAHDAGVPSSAATRAQVHCAARTVSTRRGSASSGRCSVQVFVAQSGSDTTRSACATRAAPAGRRSVHRGAGRGVDPSPSPACHTPNSRRSVACRLDRDDQLVTVLAHLAHHEPARAQPQSSTVNHQGLPSLGPSTVTRFVETPSLSVDPHTGARPRFNA